MYPIKYNDNQTKTLLWILLSPIVCIILRSKLKLTYLSESKYIVIGIWAHYINVFLAFRRTQSRFTSNSIHFFFFLLLQWLCYFHMKNFSVNTMKRQGFLQSILATPLLLSARPNGLFTLWSISDTGSANKLSAWSETL